MNNQQTLRLLKGVMVLGILLITGGHYIVSYSPLPELWGIKGLLLGASMMAIGLALSLPTKMYLTFVFVKRENTRRRAS
ncbi:hypothetical protein [Alteromonas halophila]|uniref:Uncharacterized protein n=1 Tax=Alteromonas halophila TaxID=516698 RepID=A0A918MW52_9ALTE|nr:hypothetical protein [Alteromonas halophila]GGW78489.1 hypothetical protein GCM10007391_08870 [Alteromonas halophila]